MEPRSLLDDSVKVGPGNQNFVTQRQLILYSFIPQLHHLGKVISKMIREERQH